MKLIDKAAVVAEIKGLIQANELYLSELKTDEIRFQKVGAYSVLNDLLHFLNTLEVKEMYLDFQMFAKEMETVFALPSSKTKNTEEEPLNWEYVIAKHFFELGLKAKKGE